MKTGLLEKKSNLFIKPRIVELLCAGFNRKFTIRASGAESLTINFRIGIPAG